MICLIQALNVLVKYTKIAILLISFTVVVAQKNGTVTTSASKNAQKNSTVTPTASKNAQKNSTVAATTATTTTTTTTAAETACDKCLEVIYGDCEWNEEVIPGSKTDFHFEKSGVCPCPGDDKKDKCNVVQRRIRNIPALQAWSACLFLLSICIAGKIYRIIPYNFYD